MDTSEKNSDLPSDAPVEATPEEIEKKNADKLDRVEASTAQARRIPERMVRVVSPRQVRAVMGSRLRPGGAQMVSSAQMRAITRKKED